ncbi:hypothetical protein GCM10027590_23590 [Nocardiopsis nanhaiensis]
MSPARFPDLTAPAGFQEVAERAREATGSIPVGFKLSAQHIERDIHAALDYVILDGRGGGRGGTPMTSAAGRSPTADTSCLRSSRRKPCANLRAFLDT